LLKPPSKANVADDAAEAERFVEQARRMVVTGVDRTADRS
jgi:hypothetical protein